jgi:hypothetical protein
MTMRIYDEKFLMGIQFPSGTWSFMAVEDDDLERSTQEQEEQRMTTIGFEFPQGLKS